MATPPLSDELALQAAEAYIAANYNKKAAAETLDINYQTFRHRLSEAARRGMVGTLPVLPGYRISKETAVYDADGKLVREFVQQRPDVGGEFQVPPGYRIKGESALVDANGNIVNRWVKTTEDAFDPVEAVKTAIEELREKIPKVKPTKGPAVTNDLLLNQYTITDHHFGMLAWRDETGDDDYNLKVAEQLFIDWFSAAIGISPNAETAVLAQLGDLLHYDSMDTVTPTNKHVLDSDSRIQKIIRVVIRVLRQVVSMLLQAHKHVHILMARANHDPVGGAWLRELLAALYEDEPRITVDTSADTYYVKEWGKTALFYHHGHKRGTKGRNTSGAVDAVFAGKFRDVFGRCPHSYGHLGHLHHDEMFESPLMKIERHRTLAPLDAYAAEGGWLSGRDAKVITYHKEFGEVCRHTLSPQMVIAQ